jgi:hypothetical protein
MQARGAALHRSDDGSVFSRPVEKPAVEETVPAGLVEHLRDEVDRLRGLTGMDFARWDV